ncbi:MAG: N-formylglutamate amidohydrolase [Burkholderiales bacterium]|nr:N-formylglutamate amidohydrolase [Burkholderiales bacterium]
MSEPAHPLSNPPVPFAVLGAPRAASPLVFDSPHSWRHWPAAGWPTLATPAQLDTSWDAWVDEIWAEALDGRAPLLAARFHRAYIDANRARDDIDPEMLAGPWTVPLAPSATSRRGMGLIRRTVLPDVPMYGAPLPPHEVRGRLERCYDPYHERLAQLVRSAHAAHGFSVFVDCHSMKSVGNAMNEDNGAARPDLVLGDLEGRTSDPRLFGWVAQALREAGYSVGLNHPYPGQELIRRHGRPAHGRHGLQIEIRRSLYMDEARCEKHAGFGSLVADLGRFVQRLSAALAGELGASLARRPSPPTPEE